MARNSSAGSESDGQVEAREKFMQLVTKARRLTEDGNIAGAIKLNEAALAIHFSVKLQKRIAKMKVNHSFKSSCMLFFGFLFNNNIQWEVAKRNANSLLFQISFNENIYRHDQQHISIKYLQKRFTN